ncbi:MAG TPA: peptidyl-prolyl cis-trans isomerase [Pyrinomonadaceae bacterium]|nr:peptidyl-prolyl cis-trans isomerase [Pyrinomonadaceae bacterium]
MKSKFLIHVRRVAASSALVLAALLAPFVAVPARAQEEGVPRVIDEVIAQVNADVITLSMLKKDMAEAVEALRQQRGISPQQAVEEIDKRRNEIIVTLVNEQLLIQKGKEMGLNEDVEAEVNRRMLEVAKREGLKSLSALEQAMTESGISPATVRATMRTEIMKTWVLGREVDQKIFYGLTDSEVKNYYEANKEKFRKPEAVTLSEIFLSTVGKDPKEVRERADKLVAQLRGGADFGALAMVQSEREVDGKRTAPETKGKLGTYAMSDITKPEVANALKTVKAGGIADPIETEGGIIILRVDERTAGGDAVFDENKVREAITFGRMDKERKTYLDNLRRDAYIDIAKDYQEAVLPLLKTDSPPATTPPATTPRKDEKKSDEKKSDEKKSAANGNKKQ